MGGLSSRQLVTLVRGLAKQGRQGSRIAVVDSRRLAAASHGRRDDREKESPWPRSSPARPGAATTTTDLANHLPNPWVAPPSLPSHRRPVELAYFTYFHATSAGQSIGNKILGIRVLVADTGRSLPYARAFARALMSNLSALAFFLGYFWMLWEPRKRTWHDMVAESLVVRTTSTHPANSVAPPVEQAPQGSGAAAPWVPLTRLMDRTNPPMVEASSAGWVSGAR